MTTDQSRRPGTCIAMLVTWTLFTGGCSNLGAVSTPDSQQIRITSEPQGATAFADGNEIGVTPFTLAPGNVFRTGFAGSDSALIGYRYTGKLSVKKPGCRDYVTEVDDRLLSRDIHVQLDCDPDYRPAPAPAASPQATGMPDGPEQRLRRIGDLHDKGLLSDDEYRLLRQRILDTL